MRDSNLKKLLQKHIKKVSSERMHVVVVMTSMFMPMEEQVPIFVEKNQLLLNPLKENQVDQDLSHHSQLVVDSGVAQQQ